MDELKADPAPQNDEHSRDQPWKRNEEGKETRVHHSSSARRSSQRGLKQQHGPGSRKTASVASPAKRVVSLNRPRRTWTQPLGCAGPPNVVLKRNSGRTLANLVEP